MTVTIKWGEADNKQYKQIGIAIQPWKAYRERRAFGRKEWRVDTFTTALLGQSVSVIWLLRDREGGTGRDEGLFCYQLKLDEGLQNEFYPLSGTAIPLL